MEGTQGQGRAAVLDEVSRKGEQVPFEQRLDLMEVRWQPRGSLRGGCVEKKCPHTEKGASLECSREGREEWGRSECIRGQVCRNLQPPVRTLSFTQRKMGSPWEF